MILLNIFSTIIKWYMANINYLTITLFMMVESTFIPLPSELLLPPAAWLAAQGEMNLFLIIVFSTLGCTIGALINYTLSYYLGRTIIYGFADSKYAKIFFINKEKLQKAENYFNTNGNTSTFIGRLIPGIRHLISIPAGLSKMNLRKFIIFTILGSALWNTILSLLGYFFGKNQEVLMRYYHELKYVGFGAGILFVLYLIFIKRKQRAKKS
jgi:membrane protein DedA with SNARE-associated domain